jgi:hypothetical protein
MKNRIPALAGCLLLLAASPLLADDAEDKAVEAVKKLGGKVIRDDKDPSKPVIKVNLNVSQVTDADLKELAPLKELKELHLDACHGVTDAGLKELAELKGLQTLDLWGTKVTDAVLKELAPLQGLKRLDLGYTAVTDKGLKELAPLKELKELYLYGCQGVTDKGLKELAGLKELQRLNLGGTKVTYAGVAELKKALPDCEIDH